MESIRLPGQVLFSFGKDYQWKHLLYPFKPFPSKTLASNSRSWCNCSHWTPGSNLISNDVAGDHQWVESTRCNHHNHWILVISWQSTWGWHHLVDGIFSVQSSAVKPLLHLDWQWKLLEVKRGHLILKYDHRTSQWKFTNRPLGKSSTKTVFLRSGWP